MVLPSRRSDGTGEAASTLGGGVCRAGLAPQRRRGARLESAIYEATLRELTACGYAKLTMEGVASGAHTGKAALYRRWQSKQELVRDALTHSLPEAGPLPETGSLRSDLLAVGDRLVAAMRSHPGSALRVVIDELGREHAGVFFELIHQRVVDPMTRLIQDVLAEGERRGEVRRGAACPLVADVLPAMLMYRSKMRGTEPDAAEAEAVVDQVLLPLVRAGGGDRGGVGRPSG
jgi:AcrR family transcriptional regulator